MDNEITTLDELQQLLCKEPAVLVYLSTAECRVCAVLKPKVTDMLARNFPEISAVSVDASKSPELTAQLRVFAAPTILVFFEGKEYLRKSRSFGLEELKDQINRPYQMMFP